MSNSSKPKYAHPLGYTMRALWENVIWITEELERERGKLRRAQDGLMLWMERHITEFPATETEQLAFWQEVAVIRRSIGEIEKRIDKLTKDLDKTVRQAMDIFRKNSIDGVEGSPLDSMRYILEKMREMEMEEDIT